MWIRSKGCQQMVTRVSRLFSFSKRQTQHQAPIGNVLHYSGRNWNPVVAGFGNLGRGAVCSPLREHLGGRPSPPWAMSTDVHCWLRPMSGREMVCKGQALPSATDCSQKWRQTNVEGKKSPPSPERCLKGSKDTSYLCI